MAPTKYAITMEIATGLIQEPAIPPKGYFAIKSVTKNNEENRQNRIHGREKHSNQNTL